MELMKGLEGKFCEEQLRELGGVQAGEKEAQERTLSLPTTSCTTGCGHVEVGLISQTIRDRTKEIDLKLCQRRFRLASGRISSQKGLSGIATDCPGGDGITISGDV
ncbi:hypothetical protein HGM15179_009701 [Zosterops borbonicus]|uniref:Uncharacterized protein n=1 Tax=Zosterops borbonicus TaxID=364589 RepID=A0A8K1GFS5_9PASS|nr:hypothetical protein HGM15179_009701 [Zosterops borbonicus]